MAHQQQVTDGVSTRDRLEWLNVVQKALAAGELSISAFALAYVIAFIYLNGTSGIAWPTQETLGRCLKLGVRQVRALLQDLETARFIVRTKRGRKQSDQIRLRFDRVRTASQVDKAAQYGRWLGLP